jgi:hypothetical protein
MSFPVAYRDDEARRTEHPAPEQVAPTMDTDRTAGASNEELHSHPVTEELLNEMGRALAHRLNALVDGLEEQH